MQNKNINDRYWMNIVDYVAKASTCRVEIGCVLLHKNIIIGVGYVGSISGDVHCTDEKCLLLPNFGVKGSGNNELSCERCIHAEMNAILKCNVRGSQSDGWIICYSTYSPCLSCFKILLAIGVRVFIFQKDYKDLHRDEYSCHLHENILSSLIWHKHERE